MNKSPRYIVQWDEQPVHFCKTMCSLLESQILVDITITCGSYSLRVHKCVLAASSPYLRRQLQREPYVDKIMMGDVRHTVLKAIVEFMYCGETSVYEECIHELITVANMLELRGLRAILPHKLGVVYDENKGDQIMQIKPPMFFWRGERVRELDRARTLSDAGHPDSGSYEQVVDEARVALAKEEAASRHALQMLQNDLATNLFVIEDACTEATVETSLTAASSSGQTQPVVSTACYVDVTGELLNSLAGLQQHGRDRQMEVQEAPMTLKQLVAETVAEPDYTPNIEQPVNASYASFIVDPRTLEGGEISEPRQTPSSSTPLYVPGTPIVKRRRGRPRKVKVEDLSMGSDEGSIQFHSGELPQLLELTADDIKEERADQQSNAEPIEGSDQRGEDLVDSPRLRRRCTRSSNKAPSTPLIE